MALPPWVAVAAGLGVCGGCPAAMAVDFTIVSWSNVFRSVATTDVWASSGMAGASDSHLLQSCEPWGCAQGHAVIEIPPAGPADQVVTLRITADISCDGIDWQNPTLVRVPLEFTVHLSSASDIYYSADWAYTGSASQFSRFFVGAGVGNEASIAFAGHMDGQLTGVTSFGIHGYCNGTAVPDGPNGAQGWAQGGGELIVRFSSSPLPIICSADFNCDGDVGTDADIESFFACLAGSCPAAPCNNTADYNQDGDVGTDADIEAFFRVLAGGQC